MSSSIASPGTLSVTGSVTTPLLLNDAALASGYTPVTEIVNGTTYVGASVDSLISKAGFTFPAAAKNGALLDYLQVTGANGSQVVLSEGEIDPDFGGATAASTDIIAYSANGQSIAPQLIVPGDTSTVRDLAGVLNIAVGTATVPGSALSSVLPAPVSVSGAVASPQSFTAAQLEALGSTKQTDTFLQGTSPKTYSFTGVPLLSVLTDAGLTADAADSYVIAAGSDGYGLVYSGGEINPAIRGGSTALLAYDDGTGTFPSNAGVQGALRSTAPADSKGGRYVSTLDTLAVSNAGASAPVSGTLPGAYSTSTDAVVTASLGTQGTSYVTSYSPDGSSFAAPSPGVANAAVVSAPARNATITVPTGYAGAFLLGTTAATLSDATVGHAVLGANQGNDVLAAGAGSDTLVAGGGSDTLFGAGSGSVLVGDDGQNTLVLGANGGSIVTSGSSGGSNVVFPRQRRDVEGAFRRGRYDRGGRRQRQHRGEPGGPDLRWQRTRRRHHGRGCVDFGRRHRRGHAVRRRRQCDRVRGTHRRQHAEHGQRHGDPGRRRRR